jgi:hypothetical protein
MARYKVRAPDDAAYHDLLSLLRDNVDIFVTSPRRRLLATGDLPLDFRREILSRGGQITEDRQYDIEA